MNHINSLNLIVFCGYPRTGKDHAGRVLRESGFYHFDDKAILRDMTKIAYGLNDWHVSTQDGKKSTFTIGSETIMVRQAMADLGSYFETCHGTGFFAERSISEIEKMQRKQGEGFYKGFVITSARLNQPAIYRQKGALVVELKRPGFDRPIVHSDVYDERSAHVCIMNNGDPKSFKKMILHVSSNMGHYLTMQNKFIVSAEKI